MVPPILQLSSTLFGPLQAFTLAPTALHLQAGLNPATLTDDSRAALALALIEAGAPLSQVFSALDGISLAEPAPVEETDETPVAMGPVQHWKVTGPVTDQTFGQPRFRSAVPKGLLVPPVTAGVFHSQWLTGPALLQHPPFTSTSSRVPSLPRDGQVSTRPVLGPVDILRIQLAARAEATAPTGTERPASWVPRSLKRIAGLLLARREGQIVDNSDDPHGLGGREASAAPHVSLIKPVDGGGWREQTFGHGRAEARLTKGLLGDRTRRTDHDNVDNVDGARDLLEQNRTGGSLFGAKAISIDPHGVTPPLPGMLLKRGLPASTVTSSGPSSVIEPKRGVFRGRLHGRGLSRRTLSAGTRRMRNLESDVASPWGGSPTGRNSPGVLRRHGFQVPNSRVGAERRESPLLGSRPMAIAGGRSEERSSGPFTVASHGTMPDLWRRLSSEPPVAARTHWRLLGRLTDNVAPVPLYVAAPPSAAHPATTPISLFGALPQEHVPERSTAPQFDAELVVKLRRAVAEAGYVDPTTNEVKEFTSAEAGIEFIDFLAALVQNELSAYGLDLMDALEIIDRTIGFGPWHEQKTVSGSLRSLAIFRERWAGSKLDALMHPLSGRANLLIQVNEFLAHGEMDLNEASEMLRLNSEASILERLVAELHAIETYLYTEPNWMEALLAGLPEGKRQGWFNAFVTIHQQTKTAVVTFMQYLVGASAAA